MGGKFSIILELLALPTTLMLTVVSIETPCVSSVPIVLPNPLQIKPFKSTFSHYNVYSISLLFLTLKNAIKRKKKNGPAIRHRTH